MLAHKGHRKQVLVVLSSLTCIGSIGSVLVQQGKREGTLGYES